MFYSYLENGYGKARDPDANRSRQYARHSAGRGTGRICSVKLEIPCQECVKPERLSQIRNMYALPPPVLNRQMHRLTKIGKEHVFYKKISSNRQNAITDFNLIKSISFKI